MLPESLVGLFCLQLAAAAILGVLAVGAGWRRRHWAIAIAVGLVATGSAWWSFQSRTLARQANRQQLNEDLPLLRHEREYASSSSCRACHPAEFASWHRTYHRTMTQIAEPGNVLGDFPPGEHDNRSTGHTIHSHGLNYRVFRTGDAFWAEMPDPEIMMYAVQGGRQTGEFTYQIKRDPNAPVELIDLRRQQVQRQVVMTTGSHHYQTYWVGGDDKFGRLLQTVPLIWLKRDARWIPREAAFMQPPGVRMITQWNHHCIRCHSTGGVPGLREKLDSRGNRTGEVFETRVADLGIACEACHGPGLTHVVANRDPLRRYQQYRAGENDPTIVNPQSLDHKRSSQICGQCHGVYVHDAEHGLKYAREGTLYRPGGDLHESRYYILHPRAAPNPQRWDEYHKQPGFYQERWWEDGSVLAGGREYTAMMVAPCYTRGEMSCLSCHSMHHSDPDDQLKPQMHTSLACTQCHDDARFTSNISSHTHHKAESTGSNCLNCHMPHTTYALFSAIRSHQIGTPSLESAVRYGVPHACNLCHLDKTLAWTQDHFVKWYGHEPLVLTSEQRDIAASLLWLLKGNAAQRAIVAWHFGWRPAQAADVSGSQWMAPFVAQLLADPYGVVRYVAKESLRSLPGFEAAEFDFLADQSTREAQRDGFLDKWKSLTAGNPIRRGSHLLIDEQGQLMENRLQQLLQQRDETPVSIKE